MTNEKKIRIDDYTIRDLLNAVETISKFIDFGDRANKLLSALAKAGIDISSLNTYDITTFIKLANMYRNDIDFDEEDLMRLQEDFEDILDTPLSEINRCINIINRFSSTYRRAKYTMRAITKTTGVTADELNLFAQMFGLKLPTVRKVEEIEEEIDEFTEEEKEEIREVIKKFKKS